MREKVRKDSEDAEFRGAREKLGGRSRVGGENGKRERPASLVGVEVMQGHVELS